MLSAVIALIEQMKHDELRDFIDYCEYHYLSRFVNGDERGSFLKSVRNRRAGLPTGGFPGELQILARDTKILQMTTPRQREGVTFIRAASRDDLITLFGVPKAMRGTSGAIAWAMLRAKAPIRKNSEGNIQVKWIPYKQVVRGADGKPIKDEKGHPIVETVKAPYLYLRYWQVQGDSDRKTSSVKSIYMGGDTDYLHRREGGYIYRELANHFYDLLQEHGVTRQRTIRKTGETQTYKVRPKNDDNPIAHLERQIMTCVNMDAEPPEINREALLELQYEVTGVMPEEASSQEVEDRSEQGVTRPTPKKDTPQDEQLREALKEIRLFQKMLEYASEEFERRHGRAWRWVKVYKARSGNRTLRSEDGDTFAMGTERWQVVAVLARFIETGMDHVGAFSE